MGVTFGKARIKQQPEHFPVIGFGDITPTSLANNSEARAAGPATGKRHRTKAGQLVFHQQTAIFQDSTLHAHRHQLTTRPTAIMH